MQRFNVAVPLPDGGVAVHPMKEWLRRNPEHIPPGLNPSSSTSHQLRSALKKRGWQVQETADEVRMIMPGSSADSVAIAAVLGSEEPTTEMEAAAASFALEAQLRDFIAENLTRIPVNILAVDATGNLYVFELKLDRGPDRALGQLARYMGWVKSHLAGANSVSGVLVARSIDDRLRYAAAVIPNVALLEYEVQFTVRPVEAHRPTAPLAV